MLDQNHNPTKNHHLLFQIPVIRIWKCWVCGLLVVAQEAISLIYSLRPLFLVIQKVPPLPSSQVPAIHSTSL